MGLLDKVKFWKHDDFALDIDKPADHPSPYDLNAQQFNQQFSGQPGQQPGGQFGGQQPDPTQDPFAPQPAQSDTFSHEVFGQQSYPQYPGSTPFPGSAHQAVPQEQQFAEQPAREQGIHPRDVELILAKLDGIKSELDALHQRVRKLEGIADKQNEQRNRYAW